jgi:hypothetical protein
MSMPGGADFPSANAGSFAPQLPATLAEAGNAGRPDAADRSPLAGETLDRIPA